MRPHQPVPQRPPRRRRRGSGWRKAIVAALVLLGLAVAADYGTAAAAEYQVSQQLGSHLGLADDPAVRINGFPFLTQALSGDYRDVDVTADRVAVARMRNIGVEATLHHVRVPLSDLLSGSVQRVPVDEVVGRVRIQITELGQLIDVADLRIEAIGEDESDVAVGADSAGLVQMTATTDVAGQRSEVTVIASLDLSGGQIQISAHEVEVAGIGTDQLPASVRSDLLGGFTAQLDPGALPFQVTPTAIRVENDTLVVEGTVQDVELTAGSLSLSR